MIDFKLVRKEVVELLQEIIKFDTTNPPGNERPLAEFLKQKFDAEGIENKILPAPGDNRATFWARIPGEEGGRGLLLLSHLDVVPADKKQWSVDPFSGDIKDGYIYGRGALDIKILVAMHAVVMFLLNRNNIKLKKDLIMLAVADEEEGGEAGAKYVLENFPELTECPVVLGEGGYGTVGILPDNKPMFSLSTGEKGVVWVKVKTTGQPGHGSMPIKDSAPNKLIEFLHTLINHKFPLKFSESMREFFKGMAKYQGGVSKMIMNNVESVGSIGFIRKKLEENPKLGAAIQNTISVTMANFGYKGNVIPETAEASLDCRLVPGTTVEDFLSELKKLGEPFSVEIEPVITFNPNESPLDTEIYNVIKNVLAEEGVEMFPFISPGITDTRFFRMRGSIGYGIVPIIVQIDELNRIHGIDERVSLDNLEWGTKVMFEIVKRYLANG